MCAPRAKVIEPRMAAPHTLRGWEPKVMSAMHAVDAVAVCRPAAAVDAEPAAGLPDTQRAQRTAHLSHAPQRTREASSSGMRMFGNHNRRRSRGMSVSAAVDRWKGRRGQCMEMIVIMVVERVGGVRMMVRMRMGEMRGECERVASAARALRGPHGSTRGVRRLRRVRRRRPCTRPRAASTLVLVPL